MKRNMGRVLVSIIHMPRPGSGQPADEPCPYVFLATKTYDAETKRYGVSGGGCETQEHEEPGDALGEWIRLRIRPD